MKCLWEPWGCGGARRALLSEAENSRAGSQERFNPEVPNIWPVGQTQAVELGHLACGAPRRAGDSGVQTTAVI